MREGESTSDKNKDQEPAAAGKRTRVPKRQHLSRPRSRVSRVLRSTVIAPEPRSYARAEHFVLYTPCPTV